MDYLQVKIEHEDGAVRFHTFDGDELGDALIYFLSEIGADQRTTLTWVGEEFDERTD
jgi:hypothetical protein